MVFHPHNSCVYNCCVMNESRDVPATELRSNLAAYLDEVRAGATFTITRGTRVAGRLVPPVDEEETASDD
jgi:antitoxin (DNA-binding transcriptional repressor) of toxin-antitoxin stability system